jgi:tetratricopeptide (TPR) repeat protein
MKTMTKMSVAQLLRVSKRVMRASGYLELDLPQQALDCLDEVDPVGPFAAEIEILRGEAYRRQRRFGDAAKSFKTAARMRSPDRQAYLALSMCLQQCGDVAQAVQMLAQARGAGMPKLD